MLNEITISKPEHKNVIYTAFIDEKQRKFKGFNTRKDFNLSGTLLELLEEGREEKTGTFSKKPFKLKDPELVVFTKKLIQDKLKSGEYASNLGKFIVEVCDLFEIKD